MKTVVLDQNVVELEVKPQAMLQEYRQLLAKDVKTWLAIPDQLTHRACPGCQADTSNLAFEKFGFTYLECQQCHSAYVSPCPSAETLTNFYRTARSSTYWPVRRPCEENG